MNSRFRNKAVITKLVVLFITWLTVAYWLMNLEKNRSTMSPASMNAALKKYEWAMKSTGQFILTTTDYLGISSETVKSVGSMLWRKVRARNLTFKKRNAIELAARIGVGLSAAYAGNATGVNRIARNALAPMQLYNTVKYGLVNKPGFFNMGYATRQKNTFNQVQTLLIYIMGLLAQFEYDVTMAIARTIIPQNSQMARNITNGLGATLRLKSGFAYSANNGKRTQQVVRNYANLFSAGGRIAGLYNNRGNRII
jgi:hypothetical protein